MDSSLPLVSIGMPTYNSNNKISRAFHTLMKQEYPNLEIIISDNCSTDDTAEVCRKLAEQDDRIRFFRQETNKGVWANFQFVLTKATGKYFMFLADDDRMEPEVIFKYVDYLEKNDSYSLVSGQLKYWQGTEFLFYEKDLSMEQPSGWERMIWYYGKVLHGGLWHGMMRRELAQKIPVRNVIGGDWHFIAAMAYLGKIKNLEFVSYHKYFGGTSTGFQKYAKRIGASRMAGNFPYINISWIAFKEILFTGPVFKRANIFKRFMAALRSYWAVFKRYYFLPFRKKPKSFTRTQFNALKRVIRPASD